MRLVLVTVLLVLGLATAGCGGSGRPLAVRQGMAAEQVRAAAGSSFHIGLAPKAYDRCWYYTKTPTGKPIDVEVCFSNGRVAFIDWSYII